MARVAKLILVVAIVAGLAYVWQKGWIGEWIGGSLISGADKVKRTQRDATTVRPVDPTAEDKK